MTTDRSEPVRSRPFVQGLWVGLLAPILVGLTVFAATIAWQRHTRGIVATDVVLFHPATYGAIAGDLTVERRAKRGECFRNLSLADSGIPSVYRCFARNLIFDPCWDGGGSQIASCASKLLGANARSF
jgi:hypothetical protein